MRQTYVCGIAIAAALGFALPANAGMANVVPTIRPPVSPKVSPPPKVTGGTGGSIADKGSNYIQADRAGSSLQKRLDNTKSNDIHNISKKTGGSSRLNNAVKGRHYDKLSL